MTIKYTQDHEWVQLEDHKSATVGITLALLWVSV